MNPTATGALTGALTVTRVHTVPTVSKSIAFGHPISLDARTEALELLVETFGCPPLASDTAVNEAADLLERDLPDGAVRSLMSVCDLTGAYRAIAVMVTR